MKAVAPPAVVLAPAAAVPAPSVIADLVTLVRPWQWAKNLLVIPLALLDADVWSWKILGDVALAVIAFTLASALVYIGNDVADRLRDRRHPVKRLRPIASGRVPVPLAYGYAGLIAAALIAMLSWLPDVAALPVVAYLLLNIAYSRRLKHIPLVDVCTVAAGFVLRLLQGYTATAEPISSWLVVAVFTLCLLLILGKRRHELTVSGADHRPALRGYTVALADHLLVLSAVIAVVAGLLYVRTEAPVSPYGTGALLLSLPLGLFALLRYLQAVLVDSGGGDPVRTLLTDRTLLTAGGLWAAAFTVLLVLAHTPDLATRVLP
ncbi:UbiA prenyltransferase family protein [Actinoplanes sp. TFC3]|uniref:UbiA prenyltransferase family protein n=1 Tax=Actinoplanes sp. TFC3 TaxID=1710355 RepID=UPI000AE4580F|nr:UbiA prenyltransferase family protein [Actinoplanes sp. TFC3]